MKDTTFSEEIPTALLFISISVVLEEFCGVGLLPFCEDVALGRADDVDGVNDARDGIFTDAEDRKLNGGDALIHTLVLCGVEGHVPFVQDIGGAEGVHERFGEILRFKALLDGEEFGASVLVAKPNMVGEA